MSRENDEFRLSMAREVSVPKVPKDISSSGNCSVGTDEQEVICLACDKKLNNWKQFHGHAKDDQMFAGHIHGSRHKSPSRTIFSKSTSTNDLESIVTKFAAEFFEIYSHRQTGVEKQRFCHLT